MPDRHECVQIMIFFGILFGILYLLKTRKGVIEHLTPGPPTLLTLQTDTKDLDTRLTDLKADFDKMKSQASAQAGNAAAARAQLSATKYS
jgi:hypothetical protein